MKATIKDLKDSFKVGYEAYETSRKEANQVWDMYHNRQYTTAQLLILEQRGQPAETFNVIKLFARMLVGYYSTVVNTVKVNPEDPSDIDTASILNDTVNHVFNDNRFDIEGDSIKLGGMISGLLVSYIDVQDTGKRDAFNRPIHRLDVSHVPDNEIVLDPSSQLDDYSDATWLHRFKWLTGDTVEKVFGKKIRDQLDEYYNFLNVDEADFEFNYGWEYTGYYRVFDNYLIVHSVIEDDKGERWSCFWSNNTMILKEKITFKETRWPYRVQKLHSSNRTEFYGIFREVMESQKAVNQALLKLQQMANSEKVFVEKGAVENIDDFTMAVTRINGIIPVLKLNGIKVDKLTKEILDQYAIIDKSFDRIQRILGINDSFLGMAFASDSGRKVKLQQSATIMSLRYITARIESFYRSLGWDIANLVKQYYTATQVLRIADESVGARWVELNKPMMQFSGMLDPVTGEPVYEPILLPMEDPASGDFITDAEGNIVLAPVSEEGTEFAFTEFQVDIESSSYNDEDEKAQLMLESVMSGQIGQMTAQVNPAGFFQMASLAIKGMKTKHTPELSEILHQTAQMLGQDPIAQQDASLMAQNSNGGTPKSKDLKLPQNTNEGV